MTGNLHDLQGRTEAAVADIRPDAVLDPAGIAILDNFCARTTSAPLLPTTTITPSSNRPELRAEVACQTLREMLSPPAQQKGPPMAVAALIAIGALLIWAFGSITARLIGYRSTYRCLHHLREAAPNWLHWSWTPL